MISKRFLVFLLVFLAFSSGINAQESAPVVSIMGFENSSESQEVNWLTRGIADLMESELAGSSAIRLVEREDMDEVLSEQERALSGFYDGDPLEFGTMLRANYIISGSFSLFGQTLRIDAKITHVDSAEVVSSEGVDGNLDNLFALQKELARRFRVYFGIEEPSVTTEVTFPAVENYYRGLQFYEQGDVDRAVEFFRESQKYSPLYDKPRQGIEEAYTFLRDFQNLRKQREIQELYEKVDEITRRLAATQWTSLGELYMRSYQTGEDVQAFLEENPSYYVCDEPVVCTWHLQMALIDIGNKSLEYFGQQEVKDRMFALVHQITQEAREIFAQEDFFPELLYQDLFVYQYFGQWTQLKDACEELMLDYPDYRMMYAVENFYERTLENLSQG